MTSRGQCPRGVVLVNNPASAPGPPPPFKNPGSAPVVYVCFMCVYICVDQCMHYVLLLV